MIERFPIVDARHLTMTLTERVVLTPIFVRVTLVAWRDGSDGPNLDPGCKRPHH